MIPPRAKLRKRSPRRNLVAIDGTMDKIIRMNITVAEKGTNAEPFDLHISHRESIREHVECNNPECWNGGFSLGNVLREMVANRQEEFIGTSFCTGQEGDPEEVLLHHPSCGTRFNIHATLEFR
jgi:hypothetical protein